MSLYIATPSPVRTRSSRDGLSLGLQEDVDRPLALASLKYAFVYQIGTDQGCACPLGIMVRGMPEGSTLESDEDDERYQCAMLDLLAELTAQGAVDVYPCWDGEENVRPDAHREATLADLRADWSLLRERRVTHLTG